MANLMSREIRLVSRPEGIPTAASFLKSKSSTISSWETQPHVLMFLGLLLWLSDHGFLKMEAHS